MKNVFKGIIVFVTVMSFAFAPAFAFAKSDKSNGKGVQGKVKLEQKIGKSQKIEIEVENENEDDDKKIISGVNVSSENGNGGAKKCFKALGHLIAPGWIKNFGSLSVSEDCVLPFGIAKKFRGTTHGTSTPDTSAPVISNIVISTTHNSATVSWTTNENSNSTICWSVLSGIDVSSSTVSKLVNGNMVKNHVMTLTGLSATTTYYAKVKSTDSSNNTSVSSEFSFKTKDVPVISDTTPPVISTVVALVGTTSAKILWGTNELATSKVYYSTTTPVNITSSSTLSVEKPATTTTNMIELVNLDTSTTYFALVESKDSSNNVSRSPEFTFTTQN
jgi:hypothetical protein